MGGSQIVGKVCFFKKCLSSIPIRTLCGLCVLQSLWGSISASLPKPPNPFPVVKGCVCLVGSASCRAFGHTRPASVPGLSVGLPPLVPVGGFAPKQGRFSCLPKVLHDAKPTKQATLDTPFLSTIEVFRQTGASLLCGRLAKKLLILFSSC